MDHLHSSVKLSNFFHQNALRRIERELLCYNLDFIISLGYQVKSTAATQFRMLATEHLCEKSYRNLLFPM